MGIQRCLEQSSLDAASPANRAVCRGSCVQAALLFFFGFVRGAAALAAFLANFGIELCALLALGGLAALFADIGVELRPALALDRVAAFLADPGIKLRTVLFSNCLAAVFGFG